MFDAVLLISFGGPQGRDDIRPFLANVLRGRRVTPERVEEVAHHYELFDGVSPLTKLTERQADGLRERLAAAGHPLPVYVGMRNWHPYLVDTLKQMYADGVRHAIGFIAAAHHSYSSCQQYRENVASAQEALHQEGGHVDITFVDSWFDHPQFVAANAAHIRDAVKRLPADVCGGMRASCLPRTAFQSRWLTLRSTSSPTGSSALGSGVLFRLARIHLPRHHRRRM